MAFLQIIIRQGVAAATIVAITLLITVLSVFLRIQAESKGTFTGNHAECAIVFGASVHAGKEPGPGIIRRTSTAIRLYRERTVDRLIVTGGKGSGNTLSEAQVMKNFAREYGVPEERIEMEPHARSTWDNVQFTEPLAQHCKGVIGISDGYHLARIRSIAIQQGWPDLPTLPADARPMRSFELIAGMRETLAYLYYGLNLTWLRIDRFDD